MHIERPFCSLFLVDAVLIVVTYVTLQCESMETVENKLSKLEIPYVKAFVEEGGILVDQLFFHDPDGLTIEICNCEKLPVITLAGESTVVCKRAGLAIQQKQQQVPSLPPPPPPPPPTPAAASTATATAKAK